LTIHGILILFRFFARLNCSVYSFFFLSYHDRGRRRPFPSPFVLLSFLVPLREAVELDFAHLALWPLSFLIDAENPSPPPPGLFPHKLSCLHCAFSSFVSERCSTWIPEMMGHMVAFRGKPTATSSWTSSSSCLPVFFSLGKISRPVWGFFEIGLRLAFPCRLRGSVLLSL